MSPSKQSLIERAAATLGSQRRTKAVEPASAVEQEPKAVLTSVSEADALRGKPAPEQPRYDGFGGGAVDEKRAATDYPPAIPSGAVTTIDLDLLEAHRLIHPDKSTTRTAEEFRLIKRAVLLRSASLGEGRSGQSVILVTSAKPGEGKTFTAINLALSIASEQDLHVLLVDADVVRPTVLKTLGVQARIGINDLLRDTRIGVPDVILRTNIPRLSLIPAGSYDRRATELLSSKRMRDFVRELHTRFKDRVIIFDSPPVLATSEPAALSDHADQIIFVVEAGKTSEGAIRAALDVVGNEQKISIILNKAKPFGGRQHFGAYYGYYGSS